jgi:hypothetical protein
LAVVGQAGPPAAYAFLTRPAQFPTEAAASNICEIQRFVPPAYPLRRIGAGVFARRFRAACVQGIQ